MKLTVISDTHMRHEEFEKLSGDVLIHCGDMLDMFETDEDLDNITGAILTDSALICGVTPHYGKH